MSDAPIVEPVIKHIVKRGSQWCVVSEHSGKNLGCSPSRGGAAKRLGAVEYFKHAHKSLTEDAIVAAIEDKSMIVSDAELMPWMQENKSLFKSWGIDLEEPELKSIFTHPDADFLNEDQHVTPGRLRGLLFGIMGGDPIPDLKVMTFSAANVPTDDSGVVVIDGCGCVNEVAVKLVTAGDAVAQLGMDAGNEPFDPEDELAQDLANYLQGSDLSGLDSISSPDGTAFEDGARFTFSDGTVFDAFIRNYQMQAHDDTKVMAPEPMAGTAFSIGPISEDLLRHWATLPPAESQVHLSLAAKSMAASYQCLSNMLSEYGGTETGELMAKGKALFDAGSYVDAAALFLKARDTLDPTTYPSQTYFSCLQDWSEYAQEMTLPPRAVGA